jgi:MFS family permease
MIMSDSGLGLSILAIALLLTIGHLEVWHIYIAGAVGSIFSAFQGTAYSATIPLLVPKQHLARANGMVELGEAGARLISPVLGGALLVTIHLQGVIVIDFATFLFSLITLLFVRFPSTKTTPALEAKKDSLLSEATIGWKYITSRPGLLGLEIYQAASNFVGEIFGLLIMPLVLSFTSPASLGIILSIVGAGALVGTLVMSTCGGPQRLIYSVLGFELLGGLSILVAGLRPSAPLFTVATFLAFLGVPIIYGCGQAIWQKKVPHELQGRVFATKQMIAMSSQPVAYLIAGPLADRVFEPLMAVNGPLASSIGQIIGVGPGRGIGLLFTVLGTFNILLTIVAYHYPRLRLIEDDLPDLI